METHINREGFIQINIVVKDISRAAKKWADLFGIPVPEIRSVHLEGKEVYRYEYRGEAVPSELLVCNIGMK